MSKTTRATLALTRLGIKFALRTYDYDSSADRIGRQAAQALGIEPQRMLKTLWRKLTASRSASWCHRIAKSA